MSRSFTKTFARKPDLILELIGEGTGLAKILIDQGFVLCPDSDEISPCLTLSQTLSPSSSARVDLHVSAKHLTEASPYFDTLLNGSFLEANTQASDCIQRVRLENIDPGAFALLMNVLHLCNSSLVDQRVDATTLFRLCVLIDMYEVHEQVSHYTTKWLHDLRDEIPNKPTKSIPEWLFIAYVLRDKVSFRNLTALIRRHYVELDYEPTLPLPSSILEDIQAARTKALSHCVDSITNLLHEYATENKMRCSHSSKDCDAFVLGHLVRRLTSMNFYPPSLCRAQTMSIEDMFDCLSKLEVNNLCYRKYGGSRDCGLEVYMLSISKSLRESIVGLDLP